jgi:serine/threonine protein kinase
MEDSDLLKDAGYRLHEPLGDDGWGGLYRARYLPHDREVLLRMFSAPVAGEAGAWELLLAEIGAWARIDHPGVLQVLDWGRQGDRCFLATKMPAGRPLAAVLLQEPGSSDAQRIFANLLIAVEAARRWGVLHLGLGPTNVWVAADYAVQVAEFGFWYVAREFPELKVPDGLFVAPEQGEGGHATAASDVYSLGIVYLALLFGPDAAGAAARGNSLPAGLGDLHPVVARCLERRPLARYRSAGELAGAFGLSPDRRPCREYRDCPLCQLKEELQHEAAGCGRSVRCSARPPARWDDRARYVWISIAVLAFAVVLVWWLALR